MRLRSGKVIQSINFQNRQEMANRREQIHHLNDSDVEEENEDGINRVLLDNDQNQVVIAQQVQIPVVENEPGNLAPAIGDQLNEMRQMLMFLTNSVQKDRADREVERRQLQTQIDNLNSAKVGTAGPSQIPPNIAPNQTNSDKLTNKFCKNSPIYSKGRKYYSGR